jgi:uracil-DNA glycosylase family 4
LSKTPRDIVIETLHARIAEGSAHFPRPTTVGAPTELLKSSSSSAEVLPESTWRETLLSCQECALHSARTRVVAPENFLAQRIMLVSDFPDSSDENAPKASPLFAPQSSPHNVLQRLLNYLGLANEVHRAFAIKCVSPKGIPNDALRTCSKHLVREVSLVNPDVIVCSGPRSAQSLLNGKVESSVLLSELCAVGPLTIEGRERLVLLIPAARELETFEKWRGPVAAFLKQNLAQV